MIDERHNAEAIVKFAESLLSRQFDQAVRLVGDRVLSGFKSVVVRCRVESSGADIWSLRIKTNQWRLSGEDSPHSIR
jgi:hypothetical protein